PAEFRGGNVRRQKTVDGSTNDQGCRRGAGGPIRISCVKPGGKIGGTATSWARSRQGRHEFTRGQDTRSGSGNYPTRFPEFNAAGLGGTAAEASVARGVAGPERCP